MSAATAFFGHATRAHDVLIPRDTYLAPQWSHGLNKYSASKDTNLEP